MSTSKQSRDHVGANKLFNSFISATIQLLQRNQRKQSRVDGNITEPVDSIDLKITEFVEQQWNVLELVEHQQCDKHASHVL